MESIERRASVLREKHFAARGVETHNTSITQSLLTGTGIGAIDEFFDIVIAVVVTVISMVVH